MIRGNLSLTDTEARIIIRALEEEKHHELFSALDKAERIKEINCIINDLKDIFDL